MSSILPKAPSAPYMDDVCLLSMLNSCGIFSLSLAHTFLSDPGGFMYAVNYAKSGGVGFTLKADTKSVLATWAPLPEKVLVVVYMFHPICEHRPICRRAVGRWDGPIWLHFVPSADGMSADHILPNLPTFWPICEHHLKAALLTNGFLFCDSVNCAM